MAHATTRPTRRIGAVALWTATALAAVGVAMVPMHLAEAVLLAALPVLVVSAAAGWIAEAGRGMVGADGRRIVR